MSDKILRGREGEDLAVRFLEGKGYTVQQRNFRHKKSEIDLIVQKDNWLVFVEVKTRASSDFGHPEVFVDHKKSAKILEGADHYIFEKGWQGNVRYDIVAITNQKGRPPEILHIEDAFY